MKLPCPACGVNQGGVTRLLWRADSPIGWTCRACQGRYRLASPWQTGSIAVLFGMLVLGSIMLRDRWLPGLQPVEGLIVTLLAAGPAIWVAHELVLLVSRRRLVRVEEARHGAGTYTLAFLLGMALTFAILYAWLRGAALAA